MVLFASDRVLEGFQQRATDGRLIRSAVDFSESLERHDALRHGAVTATDSETLDDRSYDFARRSHVADVANGKDEV